MNKLSPLKRGFVVFAILGVLTAIEYILSINEVAQIFLWTVAIIKLLFVVQFFMHFYRVINPDNGGQ
jgi:amino acid transporter